MNKFSQKIVDKIKKMDLKRKPRWYFVLSHVSLWTFFVISVALGSVFFSVILKFISGTEWQLLPLLGKGSLRVYLIFLPYVWIIALTLMVLLAKYVFAKTKTGYRISTFNVVLISIGISALIGSFLRITPVPDFFEGKARANIQPYNMMQVHREMMWNVPAKGVLAGEIIDISPDGVFVLNTVTGEQWRLYTKPETVMGPFVITPGCSVLASGEKVDDHEFIVYMIRPWNRLGNRFFKLPPPDFERNR